MMNEFNVIYFLNAVIIAASIVILVVVFGLV